MSIEMQVTIPIARVDMTDDYRVQLRTWGKRTPLLTSQARAFAAELVIAADRADAAYAEDYPTSGLSHGFDLAPVCGYCRDQRHDLCIGSTFVETATDIDEVECGCHAAGHLMIGDSR